MRTIKTFAFFACGLLLAALLGTSCKKDSASSPGMPTITRVAQPLDSSSINSGSFTQWVIIYGTNLSSAQSVMFNDQSVDYKTFYASDTSVTAQIPRAIPQKETNTITITTKGGTATYSFTVQVPGLQLTDMLNEYTAVGDTLTILGQNFDLYDLDTTATTVTFTGGTTAHIAGGTATTLKVVVPSGAQPGPIELKGIAPLNIDMTSTAWYMDNRNFLFNMSSFDGWNGNSWLSSGPTPAPINGPYFHLAKSWQAGWAWDPFCSDWCAIPQALVDNPSLYPNYAVKFEMNVPTGPPSMPLQLYLCFNSGDFRENYFDVSGNHTYPFTTHGQWQTFTAPLSTWSTSLAGLQYTNPMIMEFMLKDANASQSDFSICNFRIVPIK